MKKAILLSAVAVAVVGCGIEERKSREETEIVRRVEDTSKTTSCPCTCDKKEETTCPEPRKPDYPDYPDYPREPKRRIPHPPCGMSETTGYDYLA